MYDALVVGAGPAGSHVARRLAQLGHKVVVLERRSSAGEAVCCTGILGSECLERFPVDPRTISNRSRSARFYSPTGRVLSVRKDTTQAYIVDRPAYDHALARRAQEEGAEYLFSRRVADIACVNHHVTARVEHGDSVSHLDARVAVVSSGFGGLLTRKLGLGEVGDHAVGVQTEVSVSGLEEVEVYLGRRVAPGFFAWLVPTYPGRALAGLMARRSARLHLRDLLSMLSGQNRIAVDGARFTYGGIPLTPLPRTYRDNVIVVGDAAGQVKPTTGGGIYFGLICADIAADTVHDALCADDVSARRLAAYERRWRSKLAGELRIGRLARTLYERMSDSQIDHIFELVESTGIHEDLLRSPDFSFDWHGASIVNALKHGSLRRNVWAIARSVMPL